MAIRIEAVDTRTAPDSLLHELDDYYVVVEAEDMPGDPPTPRGMRMADWRNLPEFSRTLRWILREDEGIAGTAVVWYDLQQNLDNGFARVHVHPDRRRHGLGRALAEQALEHLADKGRIRVDTWIKDGDVPGETMASQLGMKSVYGEKRSRLGIADLDLDQMRSWIEQAQERASDYDMLYLPSPVPDEHLDRICALSQVMNTAPREDFEEEDEVMTPEMWRDWEEKIAAAQCQLHNLVAIQRPTGEFAGYTQIKTQDLQTDLAWQNDTGVDPAHRNRGLGRWLKAAMILRIVEEYPLVARVDTFNAGSNEPMLNINVAMGFRPVHISSQWQGDLATARERIES